MCTTAWIVTAGENALSRYHYLHVSHLKFRMINQTYPSVLLRLQEQLATIQLQPNAEQSLEEHRPSILSYLGKLSFDSSITHNVRTTSNSSTSRPSKTNKPSRS